MASSTRRSWKLQDFTAHSSNVNCLSLGHKSGRVLVTGGDDNKVNLWAVGKQNCIMSLSGHTTPIECVRFGQTEDLVCAGSQTGALKIWDLEHTKLSRTLTGHKMGVRCMDFHPYGELLASGSSDTTIKLWDIRRKGCIFTCKGHDRIVNNLKFSPDGQWIASAGEEGTVKLWDLRAGRQLREFTDHKGPATCVEFHPHEFLLASGSTDRVVHFWDLESFQLVSSSEQNSTAPVRCIFFSHGGECLFAGCQDVLKVYGWEPARTFDSVPVGWGKIQDVAIAQNQLIGAGFHASNVVLYVCDLKKISPIGNDTLTSPFSYGNSLRKSFSKERPASLKKHTMDVKTIEEDKSGTDPEDEVMFDIPNVTEYRDVFQPTRSLTRTPPPLPEAFPEPSEEPEPLQSQMIRSLSNSMSSLLSADTEENETSTSPVPISAPLPKPMPVRVHPIKSTPLIQRSPITPISSTSQIRANLQANSKNSKNLAPVPPLRQSLTPTIPTMATATAVTAAANLGKRNLGPASLMPPPKPLGPQRSNTTLTPRNAPMAAVSPVMDDGKLKSRASSPDYPKQLLKRQSSCKDGEQGYESDFPVKIHNLKHSPSDPQLNRPNTAQQTRSIGRNFVATTPLSARNHHNSNGSTSTRKLPNKAQVAPNPKTEIRVAQLKPSVQETQEKHVEFISMTADKPYGLDVESFLPKNYSGQTSLEYAQMGVFAEMSEAEVLNTMMRGHESMMAVLTSRHRSLQIIYSLWHNKDMKSAVDSAVAMNDLAVIVDLLGVLTLKPAIWNLDLCNSLIPPIGDLLKSKYEMYVTVGCSALRIILRNFAPVIKSNVEAPLHTIGVDVSREERYHKCISCYEKLVQVRSVVLKKQTMSGKLGATFRELGGLIRTID
ncbi:PREDICTED: katanin p80 WD40 repeat-containing subunit B1 [Ceratosolen solmsi marchali]|uniref:Katanin p80 WD40 repeat-containing subunit B1 n=1 Tax=Ceratosolen solmsi marchali TaxID=326594 RepID=A0AAJ6YP00_9HYME|nr:PREDICTED: katanin p80 WD40 repeat-containing subunit B1 [Ceratosolen solmsi marchali]